jgi:hypothetical protein
VPLHGLERVPRKITLIVDSSELRDSRGTFLSGERRPLRGGATSKHLFGLPAPADSNLGAF